MLSAGHCLLCASPGVVLQNSCEMLVTGTVKQLVVLHSALGWPHSKVWAPGTVFPSSSVSTAVAVQYVQG